MGAPPLQEGEGFSRATVPIPVTIRTEPLSSEHGTCRMRPAPCAWPTRVPTALGHEKQLKITSRHLFACLGDIFTHLVQLRHFFVGLCPYVEQLRVDIDRASPIAALGSGPGSTEQ